MLSPTIYSECKMTQTDQLNQGESNDPLLISLAKSTSISVDEGEETKGFLSLEIFETWIVCMCHSEGEWARQNI